MKKFLFFFVIVLLVWTALTAKAQINTPSTAAVPFGSNSSYAYGIMPTNLPTTGTYGKGTEVAAKYNAWKSAYIENCGSNQARVRFDNTSETVSEGIAYGMLLAAYAADQDLFNRLWAYYKQHRNGNGVMHWKISGCNNVIGQNGATDAELDAAMALIVANKQWPNTTSPHNYRTDAVALINAIRNYEINASDYTFENGDAWKPSCRNPSYQAPGYARVFKLFMADNGQANNAFWDNVVQRTENLLINNAHSSSGLSTNWCLPTGVPNSSCSGSGTAPDKFGYDACRAPWRQAVDYIWYGPSNIQTITNRQAAFWISQGGAGAVRGGDARNWDGSGSGDHNAAFVGPIGALSLSTSNTTANQNFCNALYTENKNDALATGYFTKILQMIGLFVQSGNFWNPYGTSVAPASTSITLTAPTALTATEGDVITLSATTTVTTGAISKVEFYVNGTLVGTDNASPYSFNWTANTTGSVNITAKATNTNGDEATTAATTVTIYKAINQTATAPTIDGTIDAVWSQNNATSINKLINGTAPSSASDLSATYKALWDNNYVYVLVDVNDDIRLNNGGTDVYNDDAVEIFFDIGNNKPTTYGTNDVQYTFRWNDPTVTATSGRSTTGITFSMAAKTGGYVLEARIPWSTLTNTPAVNQLVGFEVEVNDDDDGGNRDHKYAWNATVDDTWQNPSYMGTAKLVGTSCTAPGAAGTITGSASVCRSATGITYSISTVSGATGYNWTLPSGFTITAGSNTNAITVSTNASAASGTISVTPTNACGNGTVANFTVTANAVVTPSVTMAASATTICSGASVTFTATPTNGGAAPTYQWYNGTTAITNATSSTYTTTGLANGNQISVRMVSNAACASTTSAVSSNTVTMTVNSSLVPSVTMSASATTICSGASVTFTATPTNGGAAPTYQWYNGTTAITNATSSTYTTTGLANGNQISVRMVSNAACASTSSAVSSNTVTMTVNSSLVPSVTMATSATTICSGSSVTFTATPTNGGAAPTYQWYNGTTAITNATSSTYTTTGLTNGNQISVRMVSNATCASTTSAVSSNTVTMTVTSSVTPSVAIAASSTTICTGASVTFTATPTNGGTAPTYQWYNGANAVSGATSSTYTTTGLTNGNQISVRMVSNAACASTTSAVTSNIVTMTVTSSVTPSVAIAASSTTICTGTSVTFTATPTNGGTAPTYQWYNGANAVSGATSSTYTTTGLANGNQISVRMVSNATCASTTSAVSSNTLTMVVNATVTPSVAIAASSTTICTGASVTFTATPTNGGTAPTYQWYNGANAVSGATSSTYTTTGLANGNQISVRMVSNATCASTTSAVSSNTVTMTVTSSVTPSVAIAASSTTICTGASVTFTATPTNGGTAPTYQWYNGANAVSGATSSTYTTTGLTNGNQISVRMVSNAACASTTSAVTSNIVTMTVTSSVTPSVAIAASSTTICTGTSVTFTATPTNGGTAPTYQWYNGANAVSGATSSTYTTTGLANNNQITVRMVSNATCRSTSNAVTSNIVTMTVTSSVTPSVAIAASATTICTGTSVTFTATPTNGGAAPTYQWYNGANTISGATSSTYTTTGLANNNQITVRMVSNAACASTTSAVTSNIVTMTVTSSVTPSVAIAASATTICTGTSVTFTATPTNGGAAPTYQWYNGANAVSGATSSTYTTTGLANNNQITVRMVSNAACRSTSNAVTSNIVTMTVTSSVTPSVAIAASSTTICTGTSVTFTATPTNGGAAPTYQWYNGANAVSGATSSTYTTTGLANNNQITVRMVSNAACRSTSNAVTSNIVTMTVNASTGSAGIITGSTNVYQTAAGIQFSIAAVSGATGYNWTLPTGFTITSGANTRTITVSLSSTATSGMVTVVPTGGCGNGASSSLSVNVSTPAGFSSSITGPSTITSGQSNVTYSVSDQSGMSYTWTVPPGATIISGQGTSTIVVDFGSSTSGSVTVTETNQANQSNSISKTITVNTTTPVRPESEVGLVSLYPNPTDGRVTLKTLATVETIQYVLVDSRGVAVANGQVEYLENGIEINLPVASGVYLMIVKVADSQQVITVIKQ